MKNKLLFLLTLFSIAFLLVLTACTQTNRNDDLAVELEQTPLFTDEDTANAKLDTPNRIQEIEGTEVDTRQIGQESNLNLAVEESSENELEVQRILLGASGRVCYLRYQPKSSKAYKIYVHDQTTDVKTLIYSSRNEISSTSCNFDASIFAFTEYDGEDFELYLLTYSGISQLTDNSVDDLEPSLDANGTRVAWERNNHIYWRDLGFDSANLLTENQPQSSPKLTSKGNIISLVRLLKGGKYRIYNYDINTSEYNKIYTSADKLSNPSSSDNESFIGWKQEESGGADVVRVMDIDGNVHNIFQNSEGVDHLMLTCDGQGMSYSIMNKGNWVIYTRHWRQGKKARLQRKAGDNFFGGFWSTHCLTGVRKGQLSKTDLINYDRTYSQNFPYYIDYYDFKDLGILGSALTSQTIGDEVVLTLQSTFSSNIILYDKDQRKLSGGGEIMSTNEGILNFTVGPKTNYLIGVSSSNSSQTGSYNLSTSSGIIEPSDFGQFPPIVDDEKGELTKKDLINYDTTYDISNPHYIDYYDLADLSSDLSAQAIGDEVVLTLKSRFSFSSSVLFLYNKDKRKLSGGGTISSSNLGFLSFTIEPNTNYLIGVSSDFGGATGTYTLSTSLGSLTSSDFGKINFINSKRGRLTKNDLIDPDSTGSTHYIDYYDLKELENLSVQAVGDQVVIALESPEIANLQLSLYNKDRRSVISGGEVIKSSTMGFFSFKVKKDRNYLVGISSSLDNGQKISYKLFTSLGVLEPSDFSKYTITDSKNGKLTTDDLIDPDISDHYSSYYIDYYDLTDVISNINAQAVGDEVLLTLKSDSHFSSRLVLYNKNKRNLNGGGEIASSNNGILGFTVKSGVSYLVGVTSQYSYSTGSYKVATSAGLLKPSDFGQFTIVDSKEGELTTDDLTNPDITDFSHYIDYYDLTDLENNISVQAVGDEVALTLNSNFSSSSVLFLYDKDIRNLSGGGEITSSNIGILGFKIKSGINYLVGVSSQYETDTGSYTVSTSLGLLEPSSFGK